MLVFLLRLLTQSKVSYSSFSDINKSHFSGDGLIENDSSTLCFDTQVKK